MPSIHVTDLEIEEFRARRLPAADLVVFADHLAACADCRRRLEARADLSAARAALTADLDDLVDHASEVEIQAYVDGTLDRDRRRAVEQHLAVCASCSAEIRDLQSFARRHSRPTRLAWPRYTGLAAAAVLIIGVAVASLVRSDSGRQVTSFDDQRGTVSIDDKGTLTGLQGLTEAQTQIVRDTVRTGALSMPSLVSELAGTRGTLQGDRVGSTLQVLSPVGTAVLADRPTLRWTAVAGATTYTVTVQDEISGATTSSPPLRTIEWTLEFPLTRGHRFTWQVAAASGGVEVVAPRPPAPPARFLVLDAATIASLEALPPSHLARGILYANVGAVDDAERELAALSARNPDSAVAATLLNEVRAARRAP